MQRIRKGREELRIEQERHVRIGILHEQGRAPAAVTHDHIGAIAAALQCPAGIIDALALFGFVVDAVEYALVLVASERWSK